MKVLTMNISVKYLTSDVNILYNFTDVGQSSDDPLNEYDVKKAMNKLHFKKACGYDGISREESISWQQSYFSYYFTYGHRNIYCH